MQAVPSLVGTGTVIAAAAAGLVFGQVSDSDASRPASNKRKFSSEYNSSRGQASHFRPRASTAAPTSPAKDFPYGNFERISNGVLTPGPLSSPPTSNFACGQRTHGHQVTPPRAASKRQSFIRTSDTTHQPILEDGRNSVSSRVSSRDSWIRRFSTRPLSQHGHSSPRSSTGIESPSVAFSQNSSVPILSPAGRAAPPSQPNKLVKRGAPGQPADWNGTFSRRRSRPHMASIRRPATSHQRLEGLQQSQPNEGEAEQCTGDREHFRSLNSPRVDVASEEAAWASFFRSEVTRASGRAVAWRSEGGASNTVVSTRRLFFRAGSMPRAFLTNTSSHHCPQSPGDFGATINLEGDVEASPKDSSNLSGSSEKTPSNRPRHSISMHFSSASNWIARTGSLRRPKRTCTEVKGEGRRHVSMPEGLTSDTPSHEMKSVVPDCFSATNPEIRGLEASSHSHRRRNASSSPLPPLSLSSSFSVDVARLALSTSPPSNRPGSSQHTMGGVSGTVSARVVSSERASTLVSSDLETRDAVSVEDEDTDYTKFDSFRTVGSSNSSKKVGLAETPLESMFDESPPSTSGNSKTQRLSIQEMLGLAWTGDTKIAEEDESIPTAIRTTFLAESADLVGRDRPSVDVDFHGTMADSDTVQYGLERLTLDEEDDEEWARDGEHTWNNHLSPPSSGVNSRGASPTLRHTLGSTSGSASPESRFRESNSDRPRSNIFDWSEPSLHEKHDHSSQSPRPKTVHGKQEMDLRGGRPVNRKGPSAAHVRSQSVPIVPDVGESSKTTPKFGTWGLGSKNVSEDWDSDFEFEEEVNCGPGGKDSATGFSVAVPASIQATQPTVRAHAGQIRELSLLVNDLKRLCRHGRDLDILHGSASARFMEAQDIIALASPDEDDSTTNRNKRSSNLEPTFPDDRSYIAGLDTSNLGPVQGPLDLSEPELTKIAVVKEKSGHRRRSVMSPEDDIFGGSDFNVSNRPHTPDMAVNNRTAAVIASVVEAMQQQYATTSRPTSRQVSPSKTPESKLFFDTNSLQDLVKRAGHLRDMLSDAVRRAELLTQSPASTPRRERQPRHNADGNPAFTRVFTDPSSSPPKRLPKSHSTNSVLTRASIDSPRMHLMTVQ